MKRCVMLVQEYLLLKLVASIETVVGEDDSGGQVGGTTFMNGSSSCMLVDCVLNRFLDGRH